jgi:ketosteroid isomerase-like protein
MTGVPADVAAEVAELLYAYGAAVDGRDLEGLGRLLTDDVKLTRPDGTREGRQAFLDYYRSVFAGPATMRHFATNVRATADGDLLRATAYFQAMFFLPDLTRLVTGRYDDALQRGPGGLRITHKRNIIEYTLELPPAKA